MTKRPQEIPSVFRDDSTSAESERFQWNTDAEKLAIEKLKELGYIVYKTVKDKGRSK
jgi:hypothetical protein